MANGIYLPQRWKQQPSSRMEINWNHPLSKSLIFGWHGGSPFSDFTTGTAQVNSFSNGVSDPKFGYGFNASKGKEFRSNPLVNSATNRLTAFAFVKYPTGIDKVIISKRSAFDATGIPFELLFSNGSGGRNLAFRVRGSTNFTSISSNGIVPSDYEVLSVAATWTGLNDPGTVAGALDYYKNGRYVDSKTSGPTSSIVANSTNVMVGALPGQSEFFLGDIYFVGLWADRLNQDAIFALHQNPYQLFKTKTNSFYSLPSTGFPTLSNARVTNVTETNATPVVTYTF